MALLLLLIKTISRPKEAREYEMSSYNSATCFIINVLVMPNRRGHLPSGRYLSSDCYQESANGELFRFLRPVVIFLRFMGIQLAQPGNHGLFMRLLSVFFLVANVCVCFVVLSMVLKQSDFKTSGTISWTLWISFINEALFKLSSHFSLLILAAGSKPTQLWAIIQQLSIPGLKIRQLSKTALIIFFLVYSFQ